MTPLSDEDDASLVARCRRNESPAWAVLVQRYQRLVYAIVRRTGLDEHAAADVFQVVFSRLLTHLPRIEDPARLQAWIVTTAKREALLQRSRASRTISLTRGDDESADADESEIADEGPLPETLLSELQQADQVRRALDRLDARCRELLRLLFDECDSGPAYEDVARRLAMPVGSIGPTRSRCLGKLRRLLE